jgi:hypothetical protein
MADELLPAGLWELVEPFYPRRQGEAQGRKTSLGGQGMSHGHCVRPAQWDSLGDAAARDGLWLWNELLATTARLAGAWYLATPPFRFARLAGTLQAD